MTYNSRDCCTNINLQHKVIERQPVTNVLGGLPVFAVAKSISTNIATPSTTITVAGWTVAAPVHYDFSGGALNLATGIFTIPRSGFYNIEASLAYIALPDAVSGPSINVQLVLSGVPLAVVLETQSDPTLLNNLRIESVQINRTLFLEANRTLRIDFRNDMPTTSGVTVTGLSSPFTVTTFWSMTFIGTEGFVN